MLRNMAASWILIGGVAPTTVDRNHSITEIVQFSGEISTKRCQKKSFQIVRKAKMAMTARMGFERGTMIRTRIPPSEAPSILPASDNSRGMSSKKPYINNRLNESAPAGSQIDQFESKRPKSTKGSFWITR